MAQIMLRFFDVEETASGNAVFVVEYMERFDTCMGGLACWFWLDNACEKMWTDLLMPEDIANIDWLNSLVDWAIIYLIDE